MRKNVRQRKCKHSDHVYCERDQKKKEVSVVALPNTVVHPWTMVIKRLKRKRVKIYTIKRMVEESNV